MKMGLLEIKQSLQTDSSFRALFPELSGQIESFLKDPSCACNAPLYREVLKYPDRIRNYKGGGVRVATPPSQEFEVINCKAAELNARLKRIRRSVGAVSLARWEDEVTAVIRYLS